MRQFETTITINRHISPFWKILGFVWPQGLPPPAPGQFFTFRPKALEPGDAGLLRRPLAFAAFAENEAFALYQIRGSATKALAAAAESSPLDVIGALGKAFPLPEDGETPIILGGGIGIGPSLFLHAALCSAGRKPRPRLFLGFRAAAALPDFASPRGARSAVSRAAQKALDTLAAGLAAATLATDDGKAGFAGTVMGALAARKADKTEAEAFARPHYYACGPEPMLAALDTFATVSGAIAHVSVEQWMACGVGACQGCVLPARRGGYLRACADGPVFKSGDIAWEK